MGKIVRQVKPPVEDVRGAGVRNQYINRLRASLAICPAISEVGASWRRSWKKSDSTKKPYSTG
jgi:hypothetical protein